MPGAGSRLSGVGFSMKVPKTRVTKPASVGHGRDRLEVYLTPRRSLTMACHPRVTEWATTRQTYLPHLSKPQIRVLALWSLGMVLARSCALTAVSACLAPWLHCQDNTLRQRLREFCYEAPAKRGKARQAVVVETCFASLLAWVLRRWEGTQRALALDATPWSDRFTVLAIRVVYRGCALPIAWTVLTAHVAPAWRPEWLRMRRQLDRAVPP